MRPLAVCLLLVLLSLSARGQGANKKKFGGKEKDYEPASAGGDSDYEGQDESYYEDYEGEKSSPKTTEKPKLTSPSSHDKDGKSGSPPLFGPRRTRKPFSPKPVERARATLPSFIRHPVNPADLTTLRPPTNRPSPGPILAAAKVATTTRSSSIGSSVIRATTARPNRYKNGQPSRATTTSSDNANGNDGNRRYGGTGPRAASKNRNTYRPPGSTAK